MKTRLEYRNNEKTTLRVNTTNYELYQKKKKNHEKS